MNNLAEDETHHPLVKSILSSNKNVQEEFSGNHIFTSYIPSLPCIQLAPPRPSVSSMDFLHPGKKEKEVTPASRSRWPVGDGLSLSLRDILNDVL